jgi:murein DD-endopeptidase MepM/ murein hydrolase activator NlpD
LTIGGQGAVAAVASRQSIAIDRSALLDPDAVRTALAERRQETVERSTQRDQLEQDVAFEAELTSSTRASLDQMAGARLSRFAPEAGTWVLPVHGYRLSSLYGPRWGGTHTGLDMAAPWGTPIYAMADGEIVSAKYEGGYGNKIVIHHEDGTETWYCHQSSFEVTSGSVSAGQVIGYIGSTGNSTGPHLHLEVHPGGGDPINPLVWMREVLGLAV